MASNPPSAFGRFVEVGRVVLLPESGKLAAVVEIVDHRRVRSPFAPLLPLLH